MSLGMESGRSRWGVLAQALWCGWETEAAVDVGA